MGGRSDGKHDKMTEVELAAHCLIWVWLQYGCTIDVKIDDKGNIVSLALEHKDMSAGEDAGEWLQRHGSVECGGWADEVTQKGLDLLHKEPHPNMEPDV